MILRPWLFRALRPTLSPSVISHNSRSLLVSHAFHPHVFRHTLLNLRSLCTPTKVFRDTNPDTIQAEALICRLDAPDADHPLIIEALPLVKTAVAADSPRAKTILGSFHRDGLGVSRDTAEAQRLFTEAAHAGDPIAMCSLGVLQLDSISQPKSVDLVATNEAVAVSESGERRGVFNLMQEDGTPTEEPPSPAELVRRVRKARRRAGFTDAEAHEFEKAEHMKRERERNETHSTALEWLRRAADAGNDVGMVMLGNELVKTDGPAAREQYERAVKTARNPNAYYNLAHIFFKGVAGIERDEKAALKNLAMAAQLGDAVAQFDMGRLYQKGSDIVKVDMASARQFAELAAEQGHPGAIYDIANMHRDGEAGFEKSNGSFLRFIKESADAEYAPALAMMADMYYKGAEGIDIDNEKALDYFTRAGKAGIADALCSAAAMHFHGMGTPQDQHQAFLLYQEAAVGGSIPALRNIGAMHFQGHGVPVNREVAEIFFRTADEEEKKEREKSERDMDHTIRTAEAPQHPMADIPRSVTEADDENRSDEDAWNEAIGNDADKKDGKTRTST